MQHTFKNVFLPQASCTDANGNTFIDIIDLKLFYHTYFCFVTNIHSIILLHRTYRFLNYTLLNYTFVACFRREDHDDYRSSSSALNKRDRSPVRRERDSQPPAFVRSGSNTSNRSLSSPDRDKGYSHQQAQQRRKYQVFCGSRTAQVYELLKKP